MKAKHLLIIVSVIALTYFGLGFVTGSESVASETKGIKAAEFELKNLVGESVKLSDYKGKVVVLNFWATWCPPCTKEIPHFNELNEAFKGKDVVFLGVSVDRGGVPEVTKFMKKTPINYPVAMSENTVYETYQGYLPVKERGGIPFTFIIDKEGVIREHFVGYRPKDVWETAVNNAL